MMRKFIPTIGAILIATMVSPSFSIAQVAKFASVESVIDLKMNSTIEEVISKLGSKPYNIYSKQKDGYAIYTYKYKLVERKVSQRLINSKGGETIGTEVYNGKEHELFLLFKDDKLETLITSDGRKNSEPLILLNNTIFTRSKEREGRITVITTKIEENNSEASVPLQTSTEQKAVKAAGSIEKEMSEDKKTDVKSQEASSNSAVEPSKVTDVVAKNNTAKAAPKGTSGTVQYVVKVGDTLYSISRKFNMSLAEIKVMNPGMTNNVKLGQILKLQQQ